MLSTIALQTKIVQVAFDVDKTEHCSQQNNSSTCHTIHTTNVRNNNCA